jgi:hypothetical protein
MAKRRYTRKRKSSKKMRGGALDEQALLGLGFTSEQIASLQGYGIENMDLITMSLQQNNPQTGANFTPQELMDSLNDVQNEINNMEDAAELSDGVNPPLNEEPNSPAQMQMQMPNNVDQMPALAMEDLGPYSPRSVTEEPTGGKRRRKSMKKRNKRNKRNKQSLKRGGGGCFGNGVGANAYDPNYSIFNTRELQLFPYRPN